MNDGFLGILRLLALAAQNAGFAVIVGTLISHRWLARGGSAWQNALGRRLIATLRAASIVSLLASALMLWAHCALMSDSSLLDAGPAVWAMLEGTRFGHTWLIGETFTLIIVALSLPSAARRRRLPRAMWLAAAGIALARSNVGHPVDAGLFSLPVWIDWLHLLAISVWVGLVLVTTYVVMPRVREVPQGERTTGASFVQSLSDTATYALVVLVGTGAYNGWRGVQVPFNLIGSIYGQVLLLKLVLVLIAAALGGHNRFSVMPGLLPALKNPSAAVPSASMRRFGGVLHIESLILLAVVVAAAVLVSSPLPGTT